MIKLNRRGISGLLLAASLFAAPGAQAQGDSNTNRMAMSGTAINRRAPWQQRLTLGAGDIISISLFSLQATNEFFPNVVVGPDGRISYLDAHDVMAAGQTIDELRTNLNAALEQSSNYLSPQVVINPVAVNSKKYYVMGAVANKAGVYTMDRPLTLIEAAARAGGLEVGVFERNTVELADPSHSFLVRGGKRLDLDFEKLFWQGDLTQNVPLEPGDYVYFASSGANEIYVLGEVGLPGTVPYSPSASVIGAITTRGGFTPRSFRQRVLVVRGSLNNPQTFIVNTGDILKAKSDNFRLKPRDIVFVSIKPWQIAEDLLDEATKSFIEAVVVTYTGAKLGVAVDPLLK